MLLKRGSIGIFIIMLIVTSSFAYLSVTYAQNRCPSGAEDLTVGETLNGRIDNNRSTVQVCFEGNAGDVVKIEMKRASDSLDAYLEVTDATGDEVYATNDDRSLSSTDAEIVFELPDDGLFVINASRFGRQDGSTEGRFSLSVTSDTANSSSVSEDGDVDGCPILYDTLRYDQAITGEIDDNNYSYFYCFAGEEGDQIVIDVEATSGDLDTLLLLTDIRFEEVYAENDDRELGTRDSRIVFVLPESGPYLISMTRYDLEDGNTEGDFELTVRVNDGSFSDEDLFTVLPPNPYECNRPLIRDLNETQWIEQSERYNFRLNFGCEGVAIISIFGETFDLPYSFADGELELSFNNQTYTVDLDLNSQLTLSGEDGSKFVFNNGDTCSDELQLDLIEGVWFIGEDDTFFRLDFMCGDVVLITLESEITAYTYDLNSRQDTLQINGFNELIWTDVFILPGTQMSIETEDDGLIFTNVLTEIDDGGDADI